MPRGRKPGFVAWNKGLKMTAEQRVNSGRKPGHTPWNKGLKTGNAPWLGKKRGPMPQAWRDKIGAANRNKPKSPEHAANILASMWHGKKPIYNGMQFRSSYEVLLAKAFDARGIAWLYEPKRFNLGTCSYLPDFYLPELGVYWEAKGYFSEESKRKVRLFREQFPETPLIVATKPVIDMMAKQPLSQVVD